MDMDSLSRPSNPFNDRGIVDDLKDATGKEDVHSILIPHFFQAQQHQSHQHLRRQVESQEWGRAQAHIVTCH